MRSLFNEEALYALRGKSQQPPPPLVFAISSLRRLCPGTNLTSLAISPNQPSVNIGGTTQLTATASYSDGSSNNVSSGVAWSSADPRMVSVSASGLAAGNATGTVAITATYQGQTATAPISSSMGNIQWSGPLTITQGGTYSGNWKSTNPQTPAVSIATTEPVLIQNSYVTGPNDLISDPVYGNNVTVKNVIGIAVESKRAGAAQRDLCRRPESQPAGCRKLLLRKCGVWRLGPRLRWELRRNPNRHHPQQSRPQHRWPGK